MITKKTTVKLRRKESEVTVNRRGKPVQTKRVCLRYTAGQTEYKFDINKSVFEVEPDHAKAIMRRCDMELVPTKVAAKKVSKSK